MAIRLSILSCYLLCVPLAETSSSSLLRVERASGDRRRQTYVLARGINNATGRHASLPRCGAKNYAEGSWVRIPDPFRRTYVCCSWDGDGATAGRTLCEKPAGAGKERIYRYVADQKRTGQTSWPYFKFMAAGCHQCKCEEGASSPDRFLEFEKYEWKPSACTLDQFSAEKFCRTLNGRSLAVIGDSTGEQAGSTLMNMIIGNAVNSTRGIGCAKDITVIKSDTLVGLDNERYPQSKWIDVQVSLSLGEGEFVNDASGSRERLLIKTLVSAVETETFDIMVLSSGPHIRSVEKYQYMLATVSAAIKKRRALPHAPLFMWKTISGAGRGALNELPKLDKYNWMMFREYDALATQAMESLHVPVLDMGMLYLRGDARPPGDGLHFCSPGPVDVFPQVLSHVLSSKTGSR